METLDPDAAFEMIKTMDITTFGRMAQTNRIFLDLWNDHKVWNYLNKRDWNLHGARDVYMRMKELDPRKLLHNEMTLVYGDTYVKYEAIDSVEILRVMQPIQGRVWAHLTSYESDVQVQYLSLTRDVLEKMLFIPAIGPTKFRKYSRIGDELEYLENAWIDLTDQSITILYNEHNVSVIGRENIN